MTLGSLLLLFVADLWGWTSYLVSEFYFLAMILFLLTLPLLAEIVDSERRHRLGLQLAALGVAGLLILLSKISVGAILASAAGFLLWRRMGMTPLGLIKLAVPLLLCVILGIAIISPGASMLLQSLEPFGFIMEHPRGALPNIVANLLLLWAAYGVAAWSAGGQETRRGGCRYRDRQRRPRSPDQCPRRIRLLLRQRRDLDGNRIPLRLRHPIFRKGFPRSSRAGTGCGCDPARCACDRRKEE